MQKARVLEIVKKVREALEPLVKAATDGTLKNPEMAASRNVSHAASRQPSAEPEQEQDQAAPSRTDNEQDDLSE